MCYKEPVKAALWPCANPCMLFRTDRDVPWLARGYHWFFSRAKPDCVCKYPPTTSTSIFCIQKNGNNMHCVTRFAYYRQGSCTSTWEAASALTETPTPAVDLREKDTSCKLVAKKQLLRARTRAGGCCDSTYFVVPNESLENRSLALALPRPVPDLIASGAWSLSLGLGLMEGDDKSRCAVTPCLRSWLCHRVGPTANPYLKFDTLSDISTSTLTMFPSHNHVCKLAIGSFLP
jgi:hypothetical protein